jgi:hypothetical protein
MKSQSLMFAAVLLTALAFAFTGCSMDKNKSDNQKEEQDKLNDLRAKLLAIEGTYEGQIIFEDGSSTNSQLRLIVRTVSEGKDSDGNTRTVPVLKAQYFQEDRLSPDLDLDANYDNNSGALTLTSEKQAPAGDKGSSGGSTKNNDIAGYNVNIKGSLIAGRFSAKILTVDSSSVTQGSVEYKLISKSVDTNDGGGSNRQDYVERLRGLYSAIEGTYTTEVYPSASISAPFMAKMLFVANETTGGFPILSGAFVREPSNNYKIVYADAGYKINKNPKEIGFYLGGANGVISVLGYFKCADEPMDAKNPNKFICGRVTFNNFTATFKAIRD